MADDDLAIRALLSDCLQREGFRVCTVEDGLSALAVFSSMRFHVILLDFQMPDMSGIETAMEIRKTDLDVPIALITGVAYRVESEVMSQAGISRIFAKPFDLRELVDWIHSLSQ